MTMTEPTPPTHKLCGKHAEEWSAWLDYRQPPPPITLVQIGRPDPAATQKRQFEQWRDTIAFQQGLISSMCTEGKGCGPSTTERVLATPVPDTGKTVREYLGAILLALLHQGDTFSPGYPLGRHSYERWDVELRYALVAAGTFGMKDDGKGWDRGSKLIADAVRHMASG